MEASTNREKISPATALTWLDDQGYLKGYIITGDINLSDNSISTVDISECQIEGNLVLGVQNRTSVSIKNVKCNSVYIAGGRYSSFVLSDCDIALLEISGGVFRNGAMFEGGQIKALNILSGSEGQGRLTFSSIQKQATTIEGELSFRSEQIKIGTVGIRRAFPEMHFFEADINTFVFFGRIAEKELLFIENCDLDKIGFFKLDNNGSIKLRNSFPKKLKEESMFHLNDSTLGDFQLERMNLNSFSNVHIILCNTDKLRTNSVDWPKLINTPTKEVQVSDEEAEITYRQLKLLSIREGDKSNEIKFSAMERRMQLKGLQYWKWNTHRKNKIFWSVLRDGFILWSSWMSNNFGQSWGRAVSWLGVLSLIIFWLVLFSSCINPFALTFCELFGPYINFLNPVHDSEIFAPFLPEKKTLSGLSVLFDFLGRVVSAYLYFQIVNAFRKFYKK